MASDWLNFSLGEILDITSSKRIFRSDYCESGVPFYRSKEIIEKSKGNNISTELFISEDKFEAIKNKFGAPEPGDILLTSVGTLGVPYLVKNEDHFYFKDGNLTWFRNFSDQIMPKYLHLWFTSALAKRQIDEITIGSTQQALTISSLKSLMLKVPPLSQQKAISHILGSLNDKIELNRQMNETLEVMAQALFKSWFVDFDPVIDNALAASNAIPDELLDRAEQRKAIEKKDNSDIQSLFPAEFEFTKEMGWIPKGWSIKKAEEIASITIGKTPPRKESKWFSDTQKDNLVWVSIRDMGNSNVFINDSSEYLTKESIKKFNVKVIPRNSVMLSFKLTLGRVLIAQKELTTNEAIAHFCNPQFSMSKEYIYCYLSNFKYDSLGSTSSIATAVNSKIIKGMPFIVPSEQVLSAFETLSKIYFDKISLVNQQIDSLANLRDTLLPKLMSGELRIADAEVLVDEIL